MTILVLNGAPEPVQMGLPGDGEMEARVIKRHFPYLEVEVIDD